MAIKSNVDETVAKMTPNERASVVASTKMHVGILRAVSQLTRFKLIHLVSLNNIVTAAAFSP